MSEMQIRVILLIILVCVSCVWLFKDPRSFKDRLLYFRKPVGIVVFFFEVLLVAIQVTQPNIFPLPDILNNPLITFGGLGIYIVGALFAAWGRLSMGKSWGVPAQHEITSQKKLITKGPFKYSRNPIYVGLLLMYVGFELALRSWLILLAIPLFYLINKAIQTEEALLEKHFGKQYEVYKEKVPRFIGLD